MRLVEKKICNVAQYCDLVDAKLRTFLVKTNLLLA